jgi:hypothetical protein
LLLFICWAFSHMVHLFSSLVRDLAESWTSWRINCLFL